MIKLLKHHADSSDYAARLLEISMHALLQPAVDYGTLGDMQHPKSCPNWYPKQKTRQYRRYRIDGRP